MNEPTTSPKFLTISEIVSQVIEHAHVCSSSRLDLVPMEEKFDRAADGNNQIAPTSKTIRVLSSAARKPRASKSL
jgi:hypothetical protein